MESSDAETGMVDCGVGTIVWVRRRNGSWWPGKILGPDELPASHIMSPRSGTPVKLLGREDASVDWYNLEKSKRVKPFRCGEFDDSIERAEASQGMPPKKREKYARREDAILHALELEKQVLEKKYGKSGVQSNTKLLGKGTSVAPESSRDNGKHVDLSGLSFQPRRADTDTDTDTGSHLNVDDVLRPSFRGSQDLGSAPIPFKHNLSSLAASDGVSRGLTPEHTVVIVSSKTLLDKKRKRSQSQEGNMEESVGKRHRPLVQVLQSSAKLPHTSHPLQSNSKADGGEEQRRGVDSFDHRVEISAPTSFPVAWSEDNATGSNEDTETDSSGTESLMSDTYDAMAALSGEDMEFIPKAFGRCEGKGADEESMSDDESGDSVVTVSKWQMKGKRNSRSSSLSLRKRKEVSMSMSCSHWMMMERIGFEGYNNNSSNDGMLIDVEVGVQSGYRREHVPMISLMSKLNDKAIVGHPIPIEPLQDGSSDIILSHSQMESFPTPASDPDPDPTTPLQSWRTAKPRVSQSQPPHLSTLQEQQQQEDDDDDDEYYVEDGKQSARSLNRSSSKGIKWAVPKKPQRRTTSSCSSQKIRTLSSIGGTHQQQQQQSMDMKAAAGEEGIGMMTMKPESLPTAVACIPVKLVFSRLHEELLVARHQ